MIREARLRGGLTQAELARRMGKPQATIARWETHRAAPSFDTLSAALRECGFQLALEPYEAPDLEGLGEIVGMTGAERLDEALRRRTGDEGGDG